MATEARLGYGTLLQRYTGASWVTVAEQITINGPNLSSDDVEVTNHDSPGGSKEYIPALMDTGEISWEGNFIPTNASQQQMLTDQKNRTVADWRIVLPDATDIDNRTKWTFEGYIRNVDFSYPTQDAMRINGTMKLAGEAVLSSEYSADLTGLTISSGTLTPAFSGTVYDYAATVTSGTDSLNITPTCVAADRIYVGGELTTSGGAVSVDVVTGVNHFTVKVEEDDKTPRMTGITIARAST